jgi:hypothetical protein
MATVTISVTMSRNPCFGLAAVGTHLRLAYLAKRLEKRE